MGRRSRPARRRPGRRRRLDLGTSARRPGSIQLAGPVPAVAVLPFTDLSAGKDQGHFADGLAEEILNALVQIDGLRVAGRTSSFSFRGKDTSLDEIGRSLKVDAILDGSVRHSGSRMRVTAQLVGVTDGYQLWSQTFDREVTDVFAIQDEIAQAVAQALRVKLTPGTATAAPERRTRVPEAYEKFLLGRQRYYTRSSSDGFRSAVDAFEKSIAADPGYAPAWAGLAVALAASADYGETASQVAEFKRRAIEAADRSVALAPDLPDGYGARGFIRAGILWDWPGVKSDFERSLALNRRQPDTLRRYGTWYLGATGRNPGGGGRAGVGHRAGAPLRLRLDRPGPPPSQEGPHEGRRDRPRPGPRDRSREPAGTPPPGR